MIRHLIIRTDKPVTEESPIMKAEKAERDNRDQDHPQRTRETEKTEVGKEELSAEVTEQSHEDQQGSTIEQDATNEADQQEDIQ